MMFKAFFLLWLVCFLGVIALVACRRLLTVKP